MAENKLADLSTDFAVKILKLTDSIKGYYSLVNQLERSATSIGANICETKYAHSKADFVSKLQGTSKNSPFAIWPDLLLQQFISKSPQYTKYSGLSETFVEPKSLAQIIKKEFLEVAYRLP